VERLCEHVVDFLERFMDATPVPSPAGSPRLAVATEFGEPTVVTVVGESDLDNIEPLSVALDAALAHHPHVVLDLAGVTFADSTFLTALVSARNRAAEEGGSVRLLAVSSPVQRLLDITGADALFPAVTPAQLKRS
jgi:anti-anti-sigma factor